MNVCEKCHERDKDTIKCKHPLDKHPAWYRGYIGECDVCGENEINTYSCATYSRYCEEVMNNVKA